MALAETTSQLRPVSTFDSKAPGCPLEAFSPKTGLESPSGEKWRLMRSFSGREKTPYCENRKGCCAKGVTSNSRILSRHCLTGIRCMVKYWQSERRGFPKLALANPGQSGREGSKMTNQQRIEVLARLVTQREAARIELNRFAPHGTPDVYCQGYFDRLRHWQALVVECDRVAQDIYRGCSEV